MSDLLGWLTEPLQYQFMLRGLLISVLLGTGGGLLGCVLLQRRMALMGDALAHSILPGLGVAYLLFGEGVWSLFLGALLAGLLTATGSSLISRLTRLKEDAAFSALFIISFGVGVALVSLARERVRVNLLHFLFGNILGVGSADLWLAFTATALTVLVFAVFYRPIAIETFDPGFYRASGRNVLIVHAGILGLTVLNLVAALQAMGTVLALGLLILPAVTATFWTCRWGDMLALSVVVAVAGATLGLFTSYHLQVPSGPCIVGLLGVLFLLSAIFSPRTGLIAHSWRRGDVT